MQSSRRWRGYAALRATYLSGNANGGWQRCTGEFQMGGWNANNDFSVRIQGSGGQILANGSDGLLGAVQLPVSTNNEFAWHVYCFLQCEIDKSVTIWPLPPHIRREMSAYQWLYNWLKLSISDVELSIEFQENCRNQFSCTDAMTNWVQFHVIDMNRTMYTYWFFRNWKEVLQETLCAETRSSWTEFITFCWPCKSRVRAIRHQRCQAALSYGKCSAMLSNRLDRWPEIKLWWCYIIACEIWTIILLLKCRHGTDI